MQSPSFKVVKCLFIYRESLCLTKLKNFEMDISLAGTQTIPASFARAFCTSWTAVEKFRKASSCEPGFLGPSCNWKKSGEFLLNWSHHLKEAIPQRSFHSQFTWEIGYRPSHDFTHKFRFQKSRPPLAVVEANQLPQVISE